MELPKTKVVVSKKKWGKDSLYDNQTKCFCIMGFFLNQVCKITQRVLGDEYQPIEVLSPTLYGKAFEKKMGIGMKLTHIIVNTNDRGIHGPRKMSKLTKIFKEYLNCELTFKD